MTRSETRKNARYEGKRGETYGKPGKERPKTEKKMLEKKGENTKKTVHDTRNAGKNGRRGGKEGKTRKETAKSTRNVGKLPKKGETQGKTQQKNDNIKSFVPLSLNNILLVKT